MVSVFGEVAAEKIHKLSDSKGWKDGDPQKVALHTIDLKGAVISSNASPDKNN